MVVFWSRCETISHNTLKLCEILYRSSGISQVLFSLKLGETKLKIVFSKWRCAPKTSHDNCFLLSNSFLFGEGVLQKW